MTKWHVLTCLAIAAVGMLAFLRVVANEIEISVREAERLKKAEEAARKAQPEQPAAPAEAA